ncbi:tRNA pseudouridine(55) synthase TruB [Clostridium sp. MD294]|uniref:tRNA pseudouridine(55) synthase TruB n=1 Tax=Clostridium sp. MD294 TaxID=97138 RepID=UPI0002C91342|nr:tRNA pseudouridine(55) synthase TruB [Clostridium sp. MD294]NDO45792.1 tRNA pseudouridine(55) synthase TruB [Clostridium sp. MD294]USF30553.1 tRNA pseudouridine synthase B [Clostridium sp. MD294]
MDGIFNIYKQKGFTSHDVVAVVRKIIQQKKVGHTGTLDPDAEGVLPICVGKGTKLADYIMNGKKSYRAVVVLGITTTTQDASGEILQKKEVIFEQQKIEQVVQSFLGTYYQTPPMYSAIKVNGKKLYELAREGKEIERKQREITIFDIHITKFMPPDQFEIDVVCSKGTYIRTLCADIGEKLGCGAYMSSLLRTSSGMFSLDTAITLEQLKELAEKNQLQKALLPLNTVLEKYNSIVVSQKANILLYNGNKIYEAFFEKIKGNITKGQIVIGYDSNNTLIGIYEIITEKNGLCMKPLKILL